MSNTSGRRPPGEPSESPTTTSVDNALWLLQLVGDRQALRVAEAADLLGVARSTAHRLLTALRRRGFVMQDRPNGAYRPGPALYEVGLAAVSRIDIRRVARPVLEQLREETQETVSLALLEGTTVRFVDCVESPRSVRVGNRTGVVRPAHASAVGKAILAGLSDAELDRRYPDGSLPPASTTAALTDLAGLQAELAAIRAQGYALNWEESADGVCAVAVALKDTVGQPLAGLGVAAPSSRMADAESIRAFAPAVQRGAEQVQARLRSPS
ncbi:IclR family transcriptional regulator [Geodermatophilus ruber]|uniref:Transcriptional regulator, IclR family n=1 Tax=Geodermatophilus ruber TaxID=504800 RepID=A0A1I4HDG8_9ACTN|nr:IclR family transcriptional regulator [Geodermatophilus ruber]SFL40194.1 transcriptional regulator, IclR family [Geodermatophilus ruber]